MAGITRNPRPLFVTALPTAADGLEVYYRADNTNGVIWHLRARSVANGGSATYPWEFVGGGALAHDITTAQSRAAIGAFGDLATVGPTLTVPLAGVYDVSYGCRSDGDNADRNIAVDIKINGVQSEFSYIHASYSATDGATGASTHVPVRLTLAASDVLKMTYYTGGLLVAFTNRRMRLSPIRVG
jgi:hypothetical protein